MEIYKNILTNDFCDTLIEKIKNECVLSESHKTSNGRDTIRFKFLVSLIIQYGRFKKLHM